MSQSNSRIVLTTARRFYYSTAPIQLIEECFKKGALITVVDEDDRALLLNPQAVVTVRFENR